MLVTLAAGTLLAREFRKHCRTCQPRPVAVSRQLAGLAPPGQRYGYDLIVRVGLARYLHHLQREEIGTALARQGLALSTGSVSALCDRFLVALEALHWQRAPALRAAMPHGYPLHIDATCDKGKGGTFPCLDGWTGWVLHGVRVGSENERELRPAVEHTLAAFGDPLAVLRDLGKAGAKAVAICRQRGIPDLLCHYHFLAAVGHKLLDGQYSLLRTQISRSKVRTRWRELLRATRAAAAVRADLPALLLWMLEARAARTCLILSACPTWTSTGVASSSPQSGTAGCHDPAREPTCSATSRTCASRSGSGLPQAGNRSARNRSCSTAWTATEMVCAGIRWPAMRRAGRSLSSTAPTMSSSNSSPSPSRASVAVSAAPTWGAIRKTSRPRPPWLRTCGIRTTCRSYAARWTNCPRPSPGWTASHSAALRACSARTGMQNSAGGTGRGPKTPDSARS